VVYHRARSLLERTVTVRRSDTLISSLLAERENLLAELRTVRDENQELKLLAFGEIQYFQQLSERWSKHIRPRGYATSTRRRG
jgi:hypothetical protein